MPPYPKTSHLKETVIRQMVGSAIFVELAISTGQKWEGIKINENNALNQYDIGDYTGQHRKMLSGIIPSEEKCKTLRERLNCRNPVYWRNHPYWKLLCEQLDLFEIGVALRSIKGRINNLIPDKYPEHSPDEWRAKTLSDEEVIYRIANYSTFKALVILTALARESRDLNTVFPNDLSAYYSRKIFAYVVSNTPQLFIRWPLLALQYKNLIWSFPNDRHGNLWFPLEWNSLPDEIYREELIARKRGIKLPPKQLVRRINKNQLNSIYN